MYASREIIINIIEIPSGIIADTFGRKRALIASFIFYIFAFIFFYYSTQFWYLLLGFSFFGIGDAFRSGTHKAMIMDYLKSKDWSSQKVNYYGHTRACSQKGSALSAMFAGLIVFFGHSNIIFLISIIPYLLNIINIALYPAYLNKSSKAHNYDYMATIKSFYATIKNPKLLTLLNTSATHSAFIKAIKDYIQIVIIHIAIALPLFVHFDDNKRDAIMIGVVYTIIFLLSSYASKKASTLLSLSKGANIPNITLLMGLSFGLASGILIYFEQWYIAIIFFVGIYLIESLRKPILTAYIADNTQNEVLASVMSAQSQIKTLLTAALALSFGLLMDMYGIGISLAVISGVLLAISAVFIRFSKKEAS